MTREVADELEAALADIQLLGSPRQVEPVVAFIKEFAEKRNASAEELMQDLQRYEMDLVECVTDVARPFLDVSPVASSATPTSHSVCR